jgi:nucleotide-binding universal stress UspA family protein
LAAKKAKAPRIVVVGLDGSEASLDALRSAISACKAIGARLHLVHVVALPFIAAASAQGMGWAGVVAGMHEDGETMVRRAAKAADEARVRHSARIIEAQDVATALVRVAEDARATLVVVGSHGRTGIRRVLLGSVAERVVRLAHCPVLVVR